MLSLEEFRELLELLEDHIDARDLDEAIRTAEGFTPLNDVLVELKREGLSELFGSPGTPRQAQFKATKF